DDTIATLKGAIEAVCQLAGHEMSDTDPELGSNFMWFFIRGWDDLAAVPGLDRLIPDFAALLDRLKSVDANQYRIFRFDEAGAIKACFVFLRMDSHMQSVSADTLSLSQAVQTILLWSDTAFTEASPLAVTGETTILRPDIADVIRAAYDPVMPAVARDPSHALRLAARLGAGRQ
ncbi:MAG: hypothetical protein AAFO58_11610, partial [Pseudomonadota bacterium]